MSNCRHFTGYKPCGFSTDCSVECAHYDDPKVNLLIVHLGAMGAVVRSTALLKAMKRKYPSSRITWVTDRPSNQLLLGQPLLDRVLTSEGADLLKLKALSFDVAFVIDKSLKAVGVLNSTQADMVFGFIADEYSGAILPATGAAEEIWEIGLNDEKKFFENKKTELQLIHEALELGEYVRDGYDLHLSKSTQELSDQRRQKWSLSSDQPIIGFNTGCSDVISYKKWTVEYHQEVLRKLIQHGYKNLVLLGGPEDEIRNKQIGENLPVIQSPTGLGLQDGLASIQACDIIISGDSLGMHLGIAQKKFVIAWFGPTCSHEIDLFDSGLKLHAEVGCSPCWKRDCQKPVMCYDKVPVNTVLEALEFGVQRCKERNQSLLFKQPSLATFY